MLRDHRPDVPGAGGPTPSQPVRLLWVAAGDAGDPWWNALAAAGLDARVSHAADAPSVRAALRDPFDLILAWDDEAGRRAASVVAAVREAGAAVPVAAVAHPAAEEGLLRAVDEGAVLGFEADRPRRLPAEVRRILAREWLLTRVSLTRRIAHDLNNLLAPIPLAVQLLQRALEPAAVHGQLESVAAATRRSMHAVKELSELLSADAPTVLAVQAHHLLTLASGPWRRVPSAAPVVLTDYPSDLASVQVGLVQVLQALWCLARRAVDDVTGELGDSGELLFSGRNVDQVPATGGAGVELRVLRTSATGPARPASADSMRAPRSADRLEAILEIVKAQDGTLRVFQGGDGENGYALLLPALAPAALVPQAPRPRPELNGPRETRRRAGSPAGRTVLVIEADDEVRRMTREALEGAGWRVLTAVDGTEGVAVYAENLRAVGAVLVDMALPYMDGLSTIKALRRIGDDVTMVLTTGEDWDPRRVEGDARGPNAVLRKPYDARSLLRALGEGAS